MRQKGPRTYELKAADFPVTVRVRAKNLRECVVVVSDAHVMKGAEEAERIGIDVVEEESALSKSYRLEAPDVKAPCDIVQSIHGWFGKKPADTARYEISIAGSGGDEFTTGINVPTIDPGIANLTFQSR